MQKELLMNGIGAIGRKSGCFFCVRIYKNLSKNERENLGFLSSIEVVHGNNELLHSCVYFWGNRVERMDGSGSTVKEVLQKGWLCWNHLTGPVGNFGRFCRCPLLCQFPPFAAITVGCCCCSLLCLLLLSTSILVILR